MFCDGKMTHFENQLTEDMTYVFAVACRHQTSLSCTSVGLHGGANRPTFATVRTYVHLKVLSGWAPMTAPPPKWRNDELPAGAPF